MEKTPTTVNIETLNQREQELLQELDQVRFSKRSLLASLKQPFPVPVTPISIWRRRQADKQW